MPRAMCLGASVLLPPGESTAAVDMLTGTARLLLGLGESNGAGSLSCGEPAAAWGSGEGLSTGLPGLASRWEYGLCSAAPAMDGSLAILLIWALQVAPVTGHVFSRTSSSITMHQSNTGWRQLSPMHHPYRQFVSGSLAAPAICNLHSALRWQQLTHLHHLQTGLGHQHLPCLAQQSWRTQLQGYQEVTYWRSSACRLSSMCLHCC